MTVMTTLKRIFRRIGVFGRLLLAFVPMLVVVMAGIGIGGDEDTSLFVRVPVILISLVVFSALIWFINGDQE